jgi:prevent-host-death family protein
MDREVGAYEARTRLFQLLREVAQGARITITVHGRAVADLMPARRRRAASIDAVEAMKAFDPVSGVEAEDIAAWIAEGRI